MQSDYIQFHAFGLNRFLCTAVKPLQLFISASNNAQLNLALEEHLVTSGDSDYLLFYVNAPAVVLGKHQNPWKEIDIPLAEEKGIAIVRRLSGGGTVYHDMGNINFSFIRNKDQDFVNFREHIEPINLALNQLQIDSHISPRNDLFLGDHKISGNAEHVNNQRKRIIHHGTLLYNADLGSLGSSITPRSYTIETHAVKSVRSKVTNIRTIQDLGETPEFLDALISELRNLIMIEQIEVIVPNDIEAVVELVRTKYTQWEWTFGHTPQFKLHKNNHTYKVRKGLVIESDDPKAIGSRCDEIIS